MYFTCGLNTYVHIDVIANRYSNTAVLISKKFKNKVCLKNEITTFGFIFKKGVIIFFFLKKKIQTMPACQADATRTSLYMCILIAILQNII